MYPPSEPWWWVHISTEVPVQPWGLSQHISKCGCGVSAFSVPLNGGLTPVCLHISICVCALRLCPWPWLF